MVPIGLQKGRYSLDCGAPLLDSLRVLNGKWFALAFLEWGRSAVPTLVPFGDERGIRAKLFDVFLNFLVKTGDQSRHQHDDAHSQHNAKHGQCAAQFVRPQGIQRLSQILVICLRHACSSPVRTQGFDGIQLGRAHRRKDSEKETHAGCYA